MSAAAGGNAEPGVGHERLDGKHPTLRWPSAWARWGLRALLVLPLVLVVVKVDDLRKQPVDLIDPAAWVLIAISAVSLALGTALTWRLASAPRLSNLDVLGARQRLDRGQRRALDAALRSAEPLPPELRHEATYYVWSRRTQVIQAWVLTVTAANLLPQDTLFDDRPFLIVLAALALAALLLGSLLYIRNDLRRPRRARAHHLPLEPPPDPPHAGALS